MRRRLLSRQAGFPWVKGRLFGAGEEQAATHRKLKFCETVIEKLVLPDRVAAGRYLIPGGRLPLLPGQRVGGLFYDQAA